MTPYGRPVHGQLASSRNEARDPDIPLPIGWAAGSSPAYRRLAEAIATGLASGAIGERLPSDRQLAAFAGVSRTTAVAAYDVLVDRGVLERRPGSGTFVRRRPRSGHLCTDPLGCVMAFFAEHH